MGPRDPLHGVRLGVGCADLSSARRDDDAFIGLLRRAAASGVAHFDTSDSYGFGHNERLIGRAFDDRLHELSVATKFGQVRSPDGERTVDARPERVRAACQASLERLGSDVIDLWYLHRVDRRVPIEETVGAMGQLVHDGLVRAIGLCEVSPDSLRRANATWPISAVQTEYSLAFREPERDILALAASLGIPFVAYSPLGLGLLAGGLRQPTALREGSRAVRNDRMSHEHRDHNLALFAVLDEEARRLRCTPAQLALAWVLHRPERVVAIPGTRRVEHLEENLGALDVVVDRTAAERLDRAFSIGAVHGQRKSPEGMRLLNPGWSNGSTGPSERRCQLDNF